MKIHRQGGRDLSNGMLLLYLLGVGLWFVYGIRIRAIEVIGANLVAGCLVLAAFIMKGRSNAASPARPNPLRQCSTRYQCFRLRTKLRIDLMRSSPHI